MTIKQQGGIFGRNPSFNDVEAETLDVTGAASVGSVTSTGTYTLDMNGTNDLFYIDATGAANYQGTYKLNSNRGFAGNILGSVLAQWNGTDVAQVRFEAGSDEANQDNGRIILRTSNAGGTLVDGLEVNESQNVLVNNGNLVISTSGKGIDFSATSGTGTSELFDDYEEGVYTPTLTPAGSGASGSITLNSSFDKLAYTKIGRLVTITGTVIVSSVSSPAGTRVDISLPFTGGDTSDISERCCGLVLPKSLGSVNNAAIRVNGPSATVGSLVTVSSGTQSDIAATDFSGNEELQFTFSYIAA